LDSLKKKYGKNLNERLQTLKRERADLETIDEREQKLEKTLEKAKRATNDLASALRDKREESAKVLSKTLSATLRSLNIPTAVVEIRVTPTERSLTGDEEIAFYLQANKGEQLSLVKNSSSGGELSRLLFALKLALSERSPTPTMIFDEIDANVGGQTATLIGQLLNKLSQDQQILCITHFPQVARQADHHLCVSKRENSERTEGQITSLSKTQRERELLRMLGE
jgi:DNA repair protein RecN (Recombination protein N)